MEKIKQALDRAKAQRDTAALPAAVPTSVRGASTHPPISGTNIQYSKTRVATIDPAHLIKNHIILGESDRVGLTAYKMLRTQVIQRMAARGWNALAVTSPAQEDGKTVTSINLAISLARELNRTVLLVDMDLRHPSIHRCFGFTPDKGIGDYLLGSAEIGEVMINPNIERLVVMPGREPLLNSSEILSSQAMGALVQELKSRYPTRMVLFDLPPVLATDDALAFAPYVDAFLLVIRDGKNTVTELEQTMEIMKDTTIIGTVLNAASENVAAYY